MEYVLDHYNQWGVVIIWILLYSLVLIFLPFYKRSAIKPKSVYLAFIIAFALEMFGIPFSLYFAAWAFGINLPEGFFWGHTLINTVGHWGMYIGVVCMVGGVAMIIAGWSKIYSCYWIKESEEGELVQTGIYRYIRHPQYSGIFLITFGMMVEWLTIPQLLLWPVILIVYIRLARKEEKQMELEFGITYLVYKDETGMFFPKL